MHGGVIVILSQRFVSPKSHPLNPSFAISSLVLSLLSFSLSFSVSAVCVSVIIFPVITISFLYPLTVFDELPQPMASLFWREWLFSEQPPYCEIPANIIDLSQALNFHPYGIHKPPRTLQAFTLQHEFPLFSTASKLHFKAAPRSH